MWGRRDPAGGEKARIVLHQHTCVIAAHDGSVVLVNVPEPVLHCCWEMNTMFKLCLHALIFSASLITAWQYLVWHLV